VPNPSRSSRRTGSRKQQFSGHGVFQTMCGGSSRSIAQNHPIKVQLLWIGTFFSADYCCNLAVTQLGAALFLRNSTYSTDRRDKSPSTRIQSVIDGWLGRNCAE
jgi:hypothetical protein